MAEATEVPKAELIEKTEPQYVQYVRAPKAAADNKGVFVIYTGGTIGSMPRDPNDSESPQVVVSWEKFKSLTPELSEERLGFKVDAYSTKPLDSCNIGPKEWKEIAEVIRDNYDKYEGFVILHGTDTLVYTASALSFMLRNLGKPVILTGAQISALWSVRNDALQNLITALQIANPPYSRIPVVPEVCICFNHQLLRGNRSRKINANGFAAYESPNYSPLATIGEQVHVDRKLILPLPGPGKSFNLRSRIEPNVISTLIFPGIQDGLIMQRQLADDSVKGVVMLGYGAGNIPTDAHVMQWVKDATSNKKHPKVVLDVTQCGRGSVELGLYETSALLLDVGVVSGVDITPEAALCKLMVLLGDEDLSPEEVALLAQQDLAGEQSESIFVTDLGDKGNRLVDAKMRRERIAAGSVEGEWDSRADIAKINLRFRDAKITGPDSGVELELYMNLSSDDELDRIGPEFLGTFKRVPNGDATILVFDVTERARRVLEKRNSFTVHLAGAEGSFTWGRAELALHVAAGKGT